MKRYKNTVIIERLEKLLYHEKLNTIHKTPIYQRTKI